VAHSRVCLTVSLTHNGTQYGLSHCLTHTQWHTVRSVSLSHSHTVAHSRVSHCLTHTQWHTVGSLHNLLPSACQADYRQMTDIRPGQAQVVRRKTLTANTRLPFHSNNVGFVVDKVALVQSVPRILQLSTVSIIPTPHQTCLVIYQQFLAKHSDVK
jgi:hypothetical protein